MNDQTLRVLVVEDHPDTLMCLGYLFRRLGYMTLTADCCAAARTACRDGGPVDVVVSDVGLPDGDGVALLEELKHLYGVNSVALTAHVMPADMQRYRRSSIDRCLMKPAGVGELRDVVESFKTTRRGAEISRRIA
jgi:CheY-like chemotaxis protein